METLLIVPVLVGGLIAAAGYFISRQARLERARQWRIVAELCGLTDVEESNPFGVSDLSGRSNDLRVRFTEYRRGKQETGTRVIVTTEGGDLGWLRLRREDIGTALQEMLGTREVEVGDEGFDREFFVDGPAETVRAVFDAETRSRLRSLTGYVRLELLDGELRADLPDRSTSDLHDRLAHVTPKLLEAANRLARPTEIPQRLAQNALSDPQPVVRLECLLLLTRQFGGDPVTRATLLAADRDDSPEIRLRAAMALGADGRERLFALAASGPDEHGARAVAVLDRHLGAERALALLQTALSRRGIQTARAVVDVLGRMGGPDAVRALVRVMAEERGDLAVTAAHALGRCRLAIAEGPLIEALGREDEAPLRVAAAEALGACASVQAVLPLKEAEARHLLDIAFRRAARHAVAEIQARATGATPGQLSLAAGETGQLSLTDEDETGRLSRPSEPA
jgi:HEAT repeat protein